MNDTTLTLVGNLVEEPRVTRTTNGRVVKFRMASNSRRFDPQLQDWVPKNEIFIDVDCWGQLGDNVAVSMHKGDPVIVRGELRLDGWETPEGRRSAFKVKAFAVGPDLARGRAAFERTTRMVVPPPLSEDAWTEDGELVDPVTGAVLDGPDPAGGAEVLDPASADTDYELDDEGATSRQPVPV